MREDQEDVFGVTRFVAAVADGMGGHVGGREAAMAAVDAILTEAGTDRLDRAGLEAAFDFAASCVREGGGGGATLVVAAEQTGGVTLVAWVGDSRAYRIERDSAQQITDDHVGPDGGLERWLPDVPDLDLVRVETPPGSHLVLCSDGISDVLDSATIALLAIVDDDPAQLLVEEALAAGASDNCTAVVCAF